MPPLLYDPSHEGLLTIRWKHTVLPRVLSQPTLYLLLGVHIVTLRTHRSMLANGEKGLPVLNWKVAVMAHSLLSFFLVFYASQCYNRFYDLYTSCRGRAFTTHHPPRSNAMAAGWLPHNNSWSDNAFGVCVCVCVCVCGCAAQSRAACTSLHTSSNRTSPRSRPASSGISCGSCSGLCRCITSSCRARRRTTPHSGSRSPTTSVRARTRRHPLPCPTLPLTCIQLPLPKRAAPLALALSPSLSNSLRAIDTQAQLAHQGRGWAPLPVCWHPLLCVRAAALLNPTWRLQFFFSLLPSPR